MMTLAVAHCAKTSAWAYDLSGCRRRLQHRAAGLVPCASAHALEIQAIQTAVAHVRRDAKEWSRSFRIITNDQELVRLGSLLTQRSWPIGLRSVGRKWRELRKCLRPFKIEWEHASEPANSLTSLLARLPRIEWRLAKWDLAFENEREQWLSQINPKKQKRRKAA